MPTSKKLVAVATGSTHTTDGIRSFLLVVNRFRTPSTSARVAFLRKEGLSEPILDVHSNFCADLISNKMGGVNLQNGISANTSGKSSRRSRRDNAIMSAQNDKFNNPRALAKLCGKRRVEIMRTHYSGMSVHGIRRIVRAGQGVRGGVFKVVIFRSDFTTCVHGMINIETTACATVLFGYCGKKRASWFP